MKTLLLGAVGLLFLVCVCGDSDADEFCWKLTRIDNDSITLVGTDDTRKTAKIGRDERSKVAAFLGKSVKAHFENLKGEQWVVKLESWK